MPEFYTSVIVLTNQSKEICEKQFSVWAPKEAKLAPYLNFLYTIFNFKRDRFCALNDVIHVRTLDRRHINDVA